MSHNIFIHKLKRKIWGRIVSKTRKTKLYPYLYCSYWYLLFHNKKQIERNKNNYFTAIPNRGAGIGHQMANWIAGYWFAKQFGLKYAHSQFSEEKWEKFLCFGEHETKLDDLIKKQGYKKVLLPLFNEKNEAEINRIKKIIASYKHNNIVFIAEQDQFYKNQYGVMHDIQEKFYGGEIRKKDKLTYNKKYYNIAIHVRRGDIVVGLENKNPNLLMRFQNNSYFENVLDNVVNNIKTDKKLSIYLFSQGTEADFDSFKKFDNMHFCLDMGAMDSFLHMVYADLLITSKSSFSYKPALLSKGIKICPTDFWHGYPQSNDWILADENGNFNISALAK